MTSVPPTWQSYAVHPLKFEKILITNGRIALRHEDPATDNEQSLRSVDFGGHRKRRILTPGRLPPFSALPGSRALVNG